MKRPIHPISTRLGSVLLAACTIFSPLPLSAVTVAADTKPVTVTWGPQEQTEPGRRSVSLSADLQDGAYAAALVEVSLTEPEFSSLRKAWTDARVQESDLRVEVKKADVLVQAYDAGSAPSHITAVPLLPSGNADGTINVPSAYSFLVLQSLQREGSIQVQNHLYLPEDPTVFPAVTFKLTRETLYGTVALPDYDFEARYAVLTSDQVEQLYWDRVDAGEWKPGQYYVTGILLFDDLPLYHPDDYQYLYTVTEVKDHLKGYETWAGEGALDAADSALTGGGTPGDVSVERLIPATGTPSSVQATFVNKQPEPTERETYDSLTAVREWADNGDPYGLRPTANGFLKILQKQVTDDSGTVVWSALQRTADPQDGQDNGITEWLDISSSESFSVTIQRNTDTDTITIEPSGGILEKYAPNGMPWTYTFREPLVNGLLEVDSLDPAAQGNQVYTPSASGGIWPATICDSADLTPSFGTLTNTTCRDYSFSAEWVDADGKPVTEDCLGVDLTVEFQLQVWDDDEGTWRGAAEYFQEQGISPDDIKVEQNDVSQGEGEDWDTASLTARVNSDRWAAPGGTFTNLPTILPDGSGSYTLLQYRVVETRVSYAGDCSQTVTTPDDTADATVGCAVSGTDTGIVSSASLTRDNSRGSVSTNRLSADFRLFTVTQTWIPRNQTGPEVTVALYRTTDPSEVGTAAGDRVDGTETTLNAAGNWARTFSGLPTQDGANHQYHYYAMELDGSGAAVAHNGAVTLTPASGGSGSTYVVTYGHDNVRTTITNTLATSVSGAVTWLDGNNEGGTRPESLDLILERQIQGNPRWARVDGAVPVWEKPDGQDQWAYTYSGLPEYDEKGNQYAYQVRESLPADSGYLLKNEAPMGDGAMIPDDYGRCNFTNLRTGTVTLTVCKTWTGDSAAVRPGDASLQVEHKLITQDDDQWQDITLSFTWTKPDGGDTWSLALPGLPRYDENGVRYQYRVTETSVPAGYEGKGSANTDPDQPYLLESIRLGGLTIGKQTTGNAADPDKAFTFTVSLTGASAAGTLGTDLTGSFDVVYTRQDGSSESGTVSFTGGVSDTVIALKGGETVTIQGLPAGLSYAVAETEADQDDYSTASTGAQGTIPAGAAAEAQFVNHRGSSGGGGGGGGGGSTTVDVSGTKTWVDGNNAGGTRPDDLELKLYRSVAGGEKVQVQAALQRISKSGSQWRYVFRGLPKYDSSGMVYVYEVAETVPEGYVSTADGWNFTNTLVDQEQERVTLTGQKHWEGDTAGSRPESITVTLYDGGGQQVRRVTVTAATDWRYTFGDLPKYDAQGREIPYYVREDSVPGYQVSYSGLDITNRREASFGGLQVIKQVAGNGADYGRAFSFTATLGDDSLNGVYGDLTFTGGVARFTLAHGQTAAATDLPAGTAYTVSEAGAEGYTASASNASGTIPETGLAVVTFVNTANPSETPEEPDDAGVPDDADTPDDPGAPDDADTPGDPGVPDDPGIPDDPGAPDDPGVPDDADTPDNPDAPDDADTPDDAGGPETPAGDLGRQALYAALVLLLGGGLVAAQFLWKKQGGWKGRGR